MEIRRAGPHVGSRELDDWFAGNSARRAWQGTILQVHDAVGFPSITPAPKHPPARAALHHVVHSVGAMADPVPVASGLPAAILAANDVTDALLSTLLNKLVAIMTELASARNRMQAFFQLGPLGRVDALFTIAGKSVKDAYFSTSASEAQQALESAKDCQQKAGIGAQVVADWKPTVAKAKTTTDSGCALI